MKNSTTSSKPESQNKADKWNKSHDFSNKNHLVKPLITAQNFNVESFMNPSTKIRHKLKPKAEVFKLKMMPSHASSTNSKSLHGHERFVKQFFDQVPYHYDKSDIRQFMEFHMKEISPKMITESGTRLYTNTDHPTFSTAKHFK